MVVTKAEKSILLEEYKNCTRMLTEANRLNWTRYSIHLAISSALLTLWGTFWIYLSDKTFTGLVAFCGVAIAVTWYFVNNRSMGYNDLWLYRLRRIEFLLGGIMETFRKSREDKFWLERSFWSRRRLRYTYQAMPTVFFIVWMLILIYSTTMNFLPAWLFWLFVALFATGLFAFYCFDRWHNKRIEIVKIKNLLREERNEIDKLQKKPPWRKEKRPKKGKKRKLER